MWSIRWSYHLEINFQGGERRPTIPPRDLRHKPEQNADLFNF